MDELVEICRTGIPGYDPFHNAKDSYFDVEAAAHAVDFFPGVLTHTKGALARTPLILEDWQKAIIGNLFGWKRPGGMRRYREAFIFLPRKNGKSLMFAGVALYILHCDHEPGAEIYSAAAERNQAKLVFDMAKQMTLNKQMLSKRSQIYRDSIIVGDSSYKAISAEASTKHGFNTHAAIIDELHAQPNRELVDVLRTSVGARRQPLLVYITTSDYERQSICNEKYRYAKNIQEGRNTEDNAFLPVIYEALVDDDFNDPAVWKKANPNFGISFFEDDFRRELTQAKDTPGYLNTFLQLRLNVRTSQSVSWLSIEKWDGCWHDDLEVNLEGRECYAGLDLSSVGDLTAFVLLFPFEDRVVLQSRFWVPGDNIRSRCMRDKVPYDAWVRDGWIEATAGGSVNYETVRRRIMEDAAKYTIKGIAVDRWNASDLIRRLSDDDGMAIHPYGQGYKDMSFPTKRMEAMVAAGLLHHQKNPVLRWCASNVVLDRDESDNVKPNKKKSGERIDGMVSAIMALGLSLTDTRKSSVYETRGIRTI